MNILEQNWNICKNWGTRESLKTSNFHKIFLFFTFFKFIHFLININVLVYLKKIMYYTLSFITILSVISPFFESLFLLRYYLNTLYWHMSKRTVTTLKILCF